MAEGSADEVRQNDRQDYPTLHVSPYGNQEDVYKDKPQTLDQIE
jgi:hypothetical protein